MCLSSPDIEIPPPQQQQQFQPQPLPKIEIPPPPPPPPPPPNQSARAPSNLTTGSGISGSADRLLPIRARTGKSALTIGLNPGAGLNYG